MKHPIMLLTLYPRHGNLPVADEPYYLTSNCRNTAPIHEVGYVFYTGEPIAAPELPGPAVEQTAYDTDDAQADAIIQRVRKWVHDEKLQPEDVAVLIAKRPKAALYELLQLRSKGTGIAWAEEIHGRPHSVLLDTVARFKGLEAQAVVVWLGDEVVDERQWEMLYVGTTRAKPVLCIVSSPKASKALRSAIR